MHIWLPLPVMGEVYIHMWHQWHLRFKKSIKLYTVKLKIISLAPLTSVFFKMVGCGVFPALYFQKNKIKLPRIC